MSLRPHEFRQRATLCIGRLRQGREDALHIRCRPICPACISLDPPTGISKATMPFIIFSR